MNALRHAAAGVFALGAAALAASAVLAIALLVYKRVGHRTED